MSQLLDTPGNPWCCAPTENPRHRRPRLGAFVFGVPVMFGVLLSAPGKASALRQSVDRLGDLVSCFGRVQARCDPTVSSSAGKV